MLGPQTSVVFAKAIIGSNSIEDHISSMKIPSVTTKSPEGKKIRVRQLTWRLILSSRILRSSSSAKLRSSEAIGLTNFPILAQIPIFWCANLNNCLSKSGTSIYVINVMGPQKLSGIRDTVEIDEAAYTIRNNRATRSNSSCTLSTKLAI